MMTSNLFIISNKIINGHTYEIFIVDDFNEISLRLIIVSNYSLLPILFINRELTN